MSRTEGPVLYTLDGVEVRIGKEDWEARLARLLGVLAQLKSSGETGDRHRPALPRSGRAANPGEVRDAMPRAKGRQVIAGLDVGTTKSCCVIAEWSPVGNLDIIGVGMSPCRGPAQGGRRQHRLHRRVDQAGGGEAEEMAGVEIASVLVGIAGGHIRGVNSRGVIAVSGKHREVGQHDIDRALDAARAINLPQDREVIHVLPQTYVVDDQDGVKEPLRHVRRAARGGGAPRHGRHDVGAQRDPEREPRRAPGPGRRARGAGLRGGGGLDEEEKELGILIIDLGGGTTDVALFRDGAVWYTGVLPLGGDHISNDIAVGLRTPTSDAEELKKRYGCALTALVREDETVDVPSVGGRKARQLSRQILSEIIQPRVEEIFTLVARDLARAGLAGRGGGGRRGDGRDVDHAGRPRARRADLRPAGAARRARPGWRARRRGAEPDLLPPRWGLRSTAPAATARCPKRTTDRWRSASPADEGVGR